MRYNYLTSNKSTSLFRGAIYLWNFIDFAYKVQQQQQRTNGIRWKTNVQELFLKKILWNAPISAWITPSVRSRAKRILLENPEFSWHSLLENRIKFALLQMKWKRLSVCDRMNFPQAKNGKCCACFKRWSIAHPQSYPYRLITAPCLPILLGSCKIHLNTQHFMIVFIAYNLSFLWNRNENNDK